VVWGDSRHAFDVCAAVVSGESNGRPAGAPYRRGRGTGHTARNNCPTRPGGALTTSWSALVSGRQVRRGLGWVRRVAGPGRRRQASTGGWATFVPVWAYKSPHPLGAGGLVSPVWVASAEAAGRRGPMRRRRGVCTLARPSGRAFDLPRLYPAKGRTRGPAARLRGVWLEAPAPPRVRAPVWRSQHDLDASLERIRGSEDVAAAMALVEDWEMIELEPLGGKGLDSAGGAPQGTSSRRARLVPSRWPLSAGRRARNTASPITRTRLLNFERALPASVRRILRIVRNKPRVRRWS
jgi:hypothetical protein